jgi:hypothetical protein
MEKNSDNQGCLGLWTDTPNGRDFDCEYAPDFECDQCTFVARQYGDKRKGKKPWAKCNNNEES